MRLKVEQTGLYTYPDTIIVRGQRCFIDDHQDMLTNPQVIVEAVSPETGEYDRGDKFEHYKTIETLREYLLIDQGIRRVDHHVRQQDGRWSAVVVTEPTESVRLPSIGCELPLTEIYDKVELPA